MSKQYTVTEYNYESTEKQRNQNGWEYPEMSAYGNVKADGLSIRFYDGYDYATLNMKKSQLCSFVTHLSELEREIASAEELAQNNLTK